MKLFIADDNVEFGRMCAEVARREGWNVALCSNGRELLALLSDLDEPALVLCDINMPEVDGIEVIRTLADPGHLLRFRFVTGGSMSNALAARLIGQARDIQVGKYLAKPVTLADLRKMLQDEAQLLTAASDDR
ncbi:response regulator [Tropicibacter alexandrii]|uniref:response regulator n=1 Tax=Tropicibacter alexandrii TaxID=2267683 RepID=UPI0013E8A398|nr:response regulator [Tropicibacter alexandrii]